MHALLIAKLEAYGLGEKVLSYIYSYLTNRNQCVRVNYSYKKSDFRKIIFGVPQGSITELILFNFEKNPDSTESVYNFADDNSLSVFTKTFVELKNILQSESEVVIS